MIWFIFALGIGLWILIKSKKKSSTLKSRDQSNNQRITSEIKTYAEVVYPNAEEWAQERETAKKETQQSIDRFTKEDDQFVFLLSTRAGGLGLNLTRADTGMEKKNSFNLQVLKKISQW